MAQRAGRGAQLLKVLEAHKQKKAEEAKQIEECAKAGVEHPRVTLGKGRAALMEKFRKASEPVAVGARPGQSSSRSAAENSPSLDSDNPMTSSSDSRFTILIIFRDKLKEKSNCANKMNNSKKLFFV